ncbi:MAG: SAM-dependent methyltransferase [Holophagaceae bacterium]|nr:SAM-dependent methyltransferase [Holophagaceae bacterium]
MGSSNYDNRLLAIIQDLLGRGPVPASEFMSLALYHPEHGYYRRNVPMWGFRGKDYYTAMDLGPLLGETIACALQKAWWELDRPGSFTVYEPGAGRGWLGRDILRAVSCDFSDSIQYVHCDDSPVANQEAAQVLGPWLDNGRARLVKQDDDISAFVGAVISNELFDALPAQPWRWNGDLFMREVLISLNDKDGGRSGWEAAEPGRAGAWFGQHAEGGLHPNDGSIWVESLPQVIDKICKPLQKGLFLAIDYGDSADRLIAKGADLRRYLRHQVDGSWWQDPGNSDLTADVDFSRLAYLLECQGFAVHRPVSLGRWICNNAPLAEWEAQWLELPHETRAKKSHNLLQLTFPNAMGDRFKVLQATREPAGK